MISRRTVLAGSATMTLAASLAARASAEDMPAPEPASAAPGAQVPGIYRYRLGDFLLTALSDGLNPAPLKEGFVKNASVEEVAAALEARFLPSDTIPIPFVPLAIRSDSDLILVDTGYGDSGPPTAGSLADNMAAAGLAAEDVTQVLITHFHPDHISGLRNADGSLAFANAQIHVPEPEWAFWMDDANMSSAPEGMRGAFERVRAVFEGTDDRRTSFAWDAEVLPGITSVDAHGHTPGHTAFAIASGDEQMLLLGDTTNHPALFVRHPDWAVAFDMDADAARETRRRLLDRAASDRLQIAGYHFPFPSTGHVARDGDGYDYVPVQWTPIL